MPTVSGQVLFNTNNASPTTGTAVPGVQIAIVNSTGTGLVIDTDSSGNYSFSNVPAGSYAVIETFGTTSSGTSPGDFVNATIVSGVFPSDPPIGFMPSPPAQANDIQSLSQNTRIVTVAAANLTGQNFVDGPIQDIPIRKLDLTLVGSNMITSANNGDWGTLPNGSVPDTAPATAPYPGVVPGFAYALPSATTPGDGQYTVMNINTLDMFSTWYNTADHTSKDETGRFFLAGSSGILTIFTETLPVKSNTYYVFSGWIMNPIRAASGFLPSQLTIKVLGGNGSTIYNQSLLSIEEQNILPLWNESSTLFNTGNNTVVNFQMITAGSSGSGNDYVIDDLVIQEANVDTILLNTKSVNKEFASVGDTLDYTVILVNGGESTIQNIVFQDTIPVGTTFNPGSVKINNTTFGALNPTPPGFTLTSPSIMKTGDLVTINFSVVVNTIPSVNPIPNSSVTNYFFTPIVGGATVPQTILSNIVNTQINEAELRAVKERDLAFATIGDIITYTIPIGNFGTITANNIIFSDTIPNGTSLVGNSISINGNIITNTTPNPPGINLGSLAIGAVNTISFQVIVNTIPTINPIVNSATIKYDFSVDPVTLTVKSSNLNTNSVNTKVNAAIVTENKTVNKAFANISDTLIYTITLKNSGNTAATLVTFIDTIPNDTTFVTNSLNVNGVAVPGANPNPPGFTLGTIPIGTTFTITFNVTVNTIPNPNPILNSSSGSFNYTIDPSVPNGGSGNLNSNTVNTQVNNASLNNIRKLVDKNFVTCGDILNYTIILPNSGNITAFNVIVKDTIPNGAILVPNSVFVNGANEPGASPVLGVTIPSIGPEATATLTFQVKVQC